MIGTLYLYRCVTMYITTLPVPGMHMTCAPKVSPMSSSERAPAVGVLLFSCPFFWEPFYTFTTEL